MPQPYLVSHSSPYTEQISFKIVVLHKFPIQMETKSLIKKLKDKLHVVNTWVVPLSPLQNTVNKQQQQEDLNKQ